MRLALLLFALSATLARAQSPQDDKTEAARAIESATQTKKAAEAYTVRAERPGGKVTLKLEPEALLQWSNPVGGSFHGSVFVWTENGRPMVIASIYKKYIPLPHHLGLEFHTLDAGLVTAERGGQPEWFPGVGGFKPAMVPAAPAPAETPAQRLRQLRAISRDFNATKTDRKGLTRPLRLLTQPIYRFGSTDSSVPNGALFAFVEGTDPEVFLLIEARDGDKGPAWHYALARMNSVELHVSHHGREVWSVPIIPWSQAKNPREPYTLISYLPGEGVNPPEDVPKP